MKKLERALLFVDDKPDHQIVASTIENMAQRGAELTLAAVVQRPLAKTVLRRHGIDGDALERELVGGVSAELDEAVQQANRPDFDTGVVVLVGRPVESIVRYAEEQRFDLLIKEPSPAEGLRKDTLGSTDQRLLRGASCTVAIGRPRQHGPQRTVVAVDLDEGDEQKAALNRGLLTLSSWRRPESRPRPTSYTPGTCTATRSWPAAVEGRFRRRPFARQWTRSERLASSGSNH